MADENQTLELARARLRQAQSLITPPEEDIPPPAEEGVPQERSMVDAALRGVAEFNQALVIDYLPQNIQKKLNEMGLGVSEKAQGAGYEAIRMTAKALPFAVAPYAAGVREATFLGAQRAPTIGRAILQDIGTTVQTKPGQVLMSEVAGAAGTGLGIEAARQQGLGPEGQALYGVAGGMSLSTIPTLVPRAWDATVGTIRRNILPFTRQGGSMRAGQTIQQRVGSAEQAERYAELLDDIPEGVTPARFLQDNNLMAQEAAVIKENPEIGRRIQQELLEVRRMALMELTDPISQGPRGREQWQRAVIQNVAPDGTVIKFGSTAKMLNEAFEAFTPLYNQFKGYPVSSTPGQFIDDLDSIFEVSMNNPELIVTDEGRKAVLSWLQNKLTAYKGKGNIKTDDLIELRSDIRSEARNLNSKNKVDETDLMGSAEAGITAYLNRFLDPDAALDLQIVDSQYRQYKAIENAVYNAGDGPLTPEIVSQAIRTSGMASPSRYARGVDENVEELRALAQSGTDPINYLSDPTRAKEFMSRLDDESTQRVHNYFLEKLIDRAYPAPVAQETIEGTRMVQGATLEAEIANNIDVMRNIGMTPDQINRLEDIASRLKMLETANPAAVERIIEDGPSVFMDLAARVVGAKQGSNVSKRLGLGNSSLVLAGGFANRMRNWLAGVTEDGAKRVMVEAINNPKLYQELLRKSTTPAMARQRARTIEGYLMPLIMENDPFPELREEEEVEVDITEEPTPPPQARVQPPAPPTRGIPGMGGATPGAAPAPSPTAQGPQVASQSSREMLKSLFPMDTLLG
jgi:hypothetical protein